MGAFVIILVLGLANKFNTFIFIWCLNFLFKQFIIYLQYIHIKLMKSMINLFCSFLPAPILIFQVYLLHKHRSLADLSATPTQFSLISVKYPSCLHLSWTPQWLLFAKVFFLSRNDDFCWYSPSPKHFQTQTLYQLDPGDYFL